ncbi:MAG TPA: DUF1636 domain-containing protein [Amaricoccus sp.]|uniref:DUF1636 domain-containing protein n=1 Tax=Amaricoccus sp. TaxID=1872485 RepID=UPI001D6F505A|nr:DUF1636 domain-containing protein [Amaricoccus sp.]MCB1373693.1 DUF1636 domain-containing protein [Paracoccaceae bacterium]MCC0067140.1 DUF1636 domain-containing protein [Rhodovulum sp.]HPG22144.1 DUF1636 domain-containing protein [Amaricoccus sp.]HRW13878.1 DUF1636 domain-containing protein [Amaricoccus sp.]
MTGAAPARVTVQVCVLCGEGAAPAGAPAAGRRLFEALGAAAAAMPEITIEPVECLAVCDRVVTLAFRAPGKWSYLIGDADPDGDVADILAAARAVAASPHGVPAMPDRPPFFRRGTIARLPPGPERGSAGA